MEHGGRQGGVGIINRFQVSGRDARSFNTLKSSIFLRRNQRCSLYFLHVGERHLRLLTVLYSSKFQNERTVCADYLPSGRRPHYHNALKSLSSYEDTSGASFTLSMSVKESPISLTHCTLPSLRTKGPYPKTTFFLSLVRTKSFPDLFKGSQAVN